MTAPATSRRRTLYVVLALVAVVVVAGLVAAVVVYQVRQHRAAPAFRPAQPDELRLVHPDTGRYSANVAPVHMAGVGLYLISVTGQRATVKVIGESATPTVQLTVGRPVQAAGVTLRLVRAYDLPNDAHDAADLVVTAS